MKTVITLMTALLLGAASHALAADGTMTVSGTAGKGQIFQKVKAVKCDPNQRGVCDAAVFFDLNVAQSLPEGNYVVGFENSLYPGWVQVSSGRNTALTLERLTVPSGVKGQKIKVYRDFTTLIEQKKIYFGMYTMNRHFFRLEKNNFGDLYLTGSWERDFVQRFTHETCPKLHYYSDVPANATMVCEGWNKATDILGIRDLYDFGSSDGSFKEMWVTFPGDVTPMRHPKYLVSTPITESDFVAVFPGVYRFLSEEKNASSVQVRAGSVEENYSLSGFSLKDVGSLINLGSTPGDCFDAKTWRTELRSYCTSNNQEGCNRDNAKICEAM